jgi:hypothetical protein
LNNLPAVLYSTAEKFCIAKVSKLTRLGQTVLGCSFLLLVACSHKPLHEKDYQQWWCARHDGELEYRLSDTTRVDCLTSEYAVEVEYAAKWAEAIGQSLYYARMTNRKPAVLIIIKNHSDERFLKRLRTVAREQGIKVWTVRPQDID